MPIVGLTDRNAGFPQIGVLRKGAPKAERGPGRDLEHFRFDADDEDASMAFKAIYGDEPRAVRVYVPYATTDENFEAWREDWVASSLRHRCDGQTCVRWLTGNGSYSTEPMPCPGGCKQVGRLKVIIPELRRMAFVTVLTTSIHDIMEIHANLAALESARGDLRGIPLILRRVPREISTPNGDGKRVRRQKWLINIEAQPDWVELQLAAAAEAARPILAAASPALALPAWDEEDEAESVLIEAPAPLPALPAAPASQRKSVTHPQAIPAPNEAALTLEKQLKQACMTICNQDRTRAADLFTRQYSGLGFEQRQEALLALNAPPDEKLMAQIDDQLIRALDLGQTRQQIDEQVSQLTNGVTFSALTSMQILSIINAMEVWIDSIYREQRQAGLPMRGSEPVTLAGLDADETAIARKAGRR